MISFFTSRIGKIVGGVLVGALVIFGAVQWGVLSERKDGRIEDLESFVETKEKLNEVAPSPDRDAAIDRLRSNGLVR
jgi:hypothetical protein